jgi:pyruvate/2-oxoglutarate dehydrogenase complex dihydrolipoamide dehydrogenase (E3) component
MRQILGREDRDAAQLIEEALVGDGVHLQCGCNVVEARREEAEKVLVVETEGVKQELRVDEILIGVGRKPNVEGLGLEAAGVEFDTKAGVKIDDRLRTSNRRIFAVGDVCFRHKFTHVSDAMARMAIRNALFFGRSKASALTIPWCTYTDPEIAHVGMYEQEARDRGIEVETITVPLAEVDRAILDGEDEGFLKVHHRKGRILGATLVARHAGEMISEITLAMTAGVGLGTIYSTIHPYPTQAEVIRRAGDAFNRSRLTPRLASWMRWFLAWRR